MEERARQNGVPLHLLGFKNQTEMPAVYAASDVLILPSTGKETWGLVCNEALACGKPIVVSDAIGCAPDLAADGRVGRTFPLGDVAGCAEQLASLLASPPSEVDISTVSSRFTISVAADGILEALARTTSAAAQRRHRARSEKRA
jgi:glycosyltransferase involved in cell wall biosynthesis